MSHREEENIPLYSEHSSLNTQAENGRSIVGKIGILAGTLILAAVASITIFGGTPFRYFGISHSLHKHTRKPMAGHTKNCHSRKFVSETLKLLDEKPLAAIVGGLKPRRYEASDIAAIPGSDTAFIVADNSYRISRVKSELPFSRAYSRGIIEWPSKKRGRSGFEAIAWNETGNNFVVIKEIVEDQDGKMIMETTDVQFRGNTTKVGITCRSRWTFTHRNKGFEAGAILSGADGKSYLLGLCEGNYCAGGKIGKVSGNGIIVVMYRTVTKSGSCVYETADILNIPRIADFQDYSAMSIWNNSVIGIASQENAAVFVGKIRADPVGSKSLFSISKGSVFDFPRNDNCQIEYCNIEGLLFVERRRILAVSDAMKTGGRQSFRCLAKDQSLHAFQIP